MPMTSLSIDQTYIYQTPDPVLVYKIATSYGEHVARERWHWLSRRTLSRLVADGKTLAERHAAAQPDPDGDRVVAYALRHGVDSACNDLRLGWDVVRRAFLARGLEVPRIDHRTRAKTRTDLRRAA